MLRVLLFLRVWYKDAERDVRDGEIYKDTVYLVYNKTAIPLKLNKMKRSIIGEARRGEGCNATATGTGEDLGDSLVDTSIGVSVTGEGEDVTASFVGSSLGGSVTEAEFEGAGSSGFLDSGRKATRDRNSWSASEIGASSLISENSIFPRASEHVGQVQSSDLPSQFL